MMVRPLTLRALFLGAVLSASAHCAPTLIENVHGYTLAGDRLQRFDGLLFDQGKVLAAGDARGLHRTHADAVVIVRVNLLITDVGLPGGLNGRQVADAARTLRPGCHDGARREGTGPHGTKVTKDTSKA